MGNISGSVGASVSGHVVIGVFGDGGDYSMQKKSNMDRGIHKVTKYNAS